MWPTEKCAGQTIGQRSYPRKAKESLKTAAEKLEAKICRCEWGSWGR